jgi:hypothetical protein
MFRLHSLELITHISSHHCFLVLFQGDDAERATYKWDNTTVELYNDNAPEFLNSRQHFMDKPCGEFLYWFIQYWLVSFNAR